MILKSLLYIDCRGQYGGFRQQVDSGGEERLS